MSTDLLTLAEEALETLLLSIDGGSPSAQYDYYTQTGVVNVEDGALAEAEATEKGVEHPVNYIFDIDEEEGEEVQETSEGFDSYQCIAHYKLIARVENIGDEGNPKKAIKQRMKEVVSDLKYLFWENETLNKNVFRVIITMWVPEYIGNGDAINTGKVNMKINVEYGQFGSNPNKKACES